MKHDRAAIGDHETEALPELPARNSEAQLGILGEYIGFHLRRTQDATFRAFARQVGLRGLKPGRFSAMMVIHNNPGISQSELGRAIARDKSSITPLIRDLMDHNLLHRMRSKSDRRSVTLTLTGAGETMLRRLLFHAVAHERRLDAIVGDAKPELIRLLKNIEEALG